MSTISAWRVGFFTITMAALALPSGASAAQGGMLRGPVCEYPDLADVAPVTLELGAGDPAGSTDPIPGGRWELTELLYRPSLPITIAGDATGAIELVAGTPSAGDFSAALVVNITAPAPEMSSETGAGSYEQLDGLLNFTNECGDALTLSGTAYRVDTTGSDPVLSLWGQIDIPIKDPFPILVTIELEADFLLVEPQGVGDPVFEDRFEAP